MKNCGNCDFCVKQSGDLVCVNDQSDYLSDFVDDDHICDEWSGNEDED